MFRILPTVMCVLAPGLASCGGSGGGDRRVRGNKAVKATRRNGSLDWHA